MEWFYVDASNQRKGPVAADGFALLASQGMVFKGTVVWKQGMAGWVPIGDTDIPGASDFPTRQQHSASNAGAVNQDYFTYLDRSRKQQTAHVAELSELFGAGVVDGCSLVWTAGMKEWKPVAEVPSLKKALQGALQSPSHESKSGSPTVGGTKRKRPETSVAGQAETGSGAGASEGAAEGSAKKPRLGAEQSSGKEAEAEAAKKKKKKKKKKGFKATKENTWVYMTGLPPDVTVEEIADHFKRCGIIKMDFATKGPKVKIYRGSDGLCKGDASLCYLKAASVELAKTLLDEREIRDGFQLSVKQAVFEKKASVAPREKKKLTKEDRAAKMLFLKQQAALSWADDGQEDDTLQLKIVVLKNVFDPSEFTGEEAKEDIVELEHDVQAECSKLGDVDNVKVFAHRVDGAVVIKFKRGHAAKHCVDKMNGRFLGGRKLTCEFWDGVTNYSERDAPSSVAAQQDKEAEEEELKRLDAFGDWLEGGSDSDSDDLAVATEE